MELVYQFYKKIKKNNETTENGDKGQNSYLDDKEKNEKKLKEKRMKSKSKSLHGEKKSFKTKIKKSSHHSVKVILIESNPNDKKLIEKINDNVDEENSILKNNCINNIKTNNNENGFPFNNINITNETNSIKSNNGHNSSENNKLSTKHERLTQSSEDSKYELTINLVKHLQNFFTNNRIVIKKEDGKYFKPTNEDIGINAI